MSNKRNKNKKKGFTLIELLVIVLIIGVLAVIALPIYFSALEKTRAGESVQLLSAITKAQQRYKVQSQEYSENIESLDITVKNYSTGEEATGSEFDSQYFNFTLGEDYALAARKNGDYFLGMDYDTYAIYCGGNDTSICARFGLEVRNIPNNSNSDSWSNCNGAFASLRGYEPPSCQMKSDGSGGTIFKTDSSYEFGSGMSREEHQYFYDQNNTLKEIKRCDYYTPEGGEEVRPVDRCVRRHAQAAALGRALGDVRR